MPIDLIVDASVLAKFYFHEEGSERARDILTSGAVVAAPELIVIEIASVAAKRFRLGLSDLDRAGEAVASIGDVVDELVPLTGLATAAFRIACEIGCSAYDASYLALAQQREVPVLTADLRLASRAETTILRRFIKRL